MLPEGQIYRIYLDTLDRPDTESSAGGEAGKPWSKVGYYIVGAGAAAGFSWITYEAVYSGNQPISPAKPQALAYLRECLQLGQLACRGSRGDRFGGEFFAFPKILSYARND